MKNYRKSSKNQNAFLKKMGQNYIGSEHFLLALAFVEDTAPYVVLTENGITVQSIISILGNTIIPSETVAAEKNKYTKTAEEILDHAVNEAKRLGSTEVGSEHLLIAILKNLSCTAVKIMLSLKSKSAEGLCRYYGSLRN